MITNKGRNLIAKYLLGQAPSYASFISFGCGAEPGEAVTGNEDCMKFEMLRVPISSRSTLNEGTLDKISFAGDIPLEQQYEITEVAIWSDASNAAAQSDSRVLFAFTADENWQINDVTTDTPIPFINDPLGPLEPADVAGNIVQTDPIFSCDADNLSLVSNRPGQGARFLNRTIMVRGDVTDQKIFLNGRSVNLSLNSGTDLMKLAFAMYPKDIIIPGQPFASPDVGVTIRFKTDANIPVTDDNAPPAGTAVWKVSPQATSKFNVFETELKDIKTGASFDWAGVRYTEIEFDNFGSDWYAGVDAIRFDNITTPNPLYVMSGYAIVSTATGMIIKRANTNAYAEFRFGLTI